MSLKIQSGINKRFAKVQANIKLNNFKILKLYFTSR